MRQGQVRGSALSVPFPACGCRAYISISQWCDAVAKGLSGPARRAGSLETGFGTPHPTTVMISNQIL